MFPEEWKSAEWHRSRECYVEEDGDYIRIGNSILERVFSREGGRLRTVSITNKLTDRTWNIEATDESRLTLGVAKFRFDIKAWRFALGSKQPVDPSGRSGISQRLPPPLDRRSILEDPRVPHCRLR